VPTYSEVLKAGEKIARSKGMEASGVKLLMMHFSHLTPTKLYLSIDDSMPEEFRLEFLKAVDQYVNHHRPVQYLMGYVSFYGYDFTVNDSVLIPRFETEELVANVLIQYDKLFKGQTAKLVDVGTGSGCLAVSLAMEEPHLEVTATDISPEALEVAKGNAERIGAKVEFIQGDMLLPLQGRKFDILVSNPPYIPDNETVAEIIKDYEPNIALFGGSDGLKFYRIILSQASSILNDKFIMGFEHGYDKAEEIRTMAKSIYPNAEIFTIQDLSKRDRMTFIVNK
jgi:release factor glutamine methyltransferase